MSVAWWPDRPDHKPATSQAETDADPHGKVHCEGIIWPGARAGQGGRRMTAQGPGWLDEPVGLAQAVSEWACSCGHEPEGREIAPAPGYEPGRRIYLAARYSRNAEMRGVRDVLEGLGHKVTSRWIDQHGGTVLACQGRVRGAFPFALSHLTRDLRTMPDMGPTVDQRFEDPPVSS